MQKIKRTAIILCGGKGTRLGAISKKIPKTLIKIHNLTEGLVSPNDFCLQEDKNYDVNESQKIELKKFHQHILSGSRKHLGNAITLIL